MRICQGVMLLIVAVQVLGAVYLLLTEGLGPAMLALMLAIAAVYVGLFAWCKRDPLTASIVGLVVFVVIHVIEALIDPAALVRGFVVIMVLIAALVWAVASGMKHRKLVRERSRDRG